MSPYRKRLDNGRLEPLCPIPFGWFRRDGALWQCPHCGALYKLSRGVDLTGTTWKSWVREPTRL